MADGEMGLGQGVLSAAAARVADARAELDHLDRELAHRIDAARTRWTGAGGAAFQSLGQAWSQRQRTVVAALGSFEDALRSTERDVLATDDARAAELARAQRRLA